MPSFGCAHFNAIVVQLQVTVGSAVSVVTSVEFVHFVVGRCSKVTG